MCARTCACSCSLSKCAHAHVGTPTHSRSPCSVHARSHVCTSTHSRVPARCAHTLPASMGPWPPVAHGCGGSRPKCCELDPAVLPSTAQVTGRAAAPPSPASTGSVTPVETQGDEGAGARAGRHGGRAPAPPVGVGRRARRQTHARPGPLITQEPSGPESCSCVMLEMDAQGQRVLSGWGHPKESPGEAGNRRNAEGRARWQTSVGGGSEHVHPPELTHSQPRPHRCPGGQGKQAGLIRRPTPGDRRARTGNAPGLGRRGQPARTWLWKVLGGTAGGAVAGRSEREARRRWAPVLGAPCPPCGVCGRGPPRLASIAHSCCTLAGRLQARLSGWAPGVGAVGTRWGRGGVAVLVAAGGPGDSTLPPPGHTLALMRAERPAGLPSTQQRQRGPCPGRATCTRPLTRTRPRL